MRLGHVGELAEGRGADASHAEGESEEEAGDHADAVGDEILRVDEDRGESGGDDEADDDAQDAGPEEIGVGKDQGEGQDAENGAPDDGLTAYAVADGATHKGSGGYRGEEGEEMELRAAHGHVEAGDEVEGVVAGEAREIDVLREDQCA